MIQKLVCAVIVFCGSVAAHDSYTGGHSGAPGTSSCAASCHAGTGGTLTVTGFPSMYNPGQTYRVVVAHSGGAQIVNFNATTRVGSTSSVAGTFAAVINSALYSGADGGVYANPHGIDSAVFQWTAPASGTGLVNFYASAFQGTSTSANGQSKTVTLSATQSTTTVDEQTQVPERFVLAQNYPNPFNPSTTIEFQLPAGSFVSLKVYDAIGSELATLINGNLPAGQHRITFDAGSLASGVYMYQLKSSLSTQTRKMVLMK